jgi:trans-aconitate methyltransferase
METQRADPPRPRRADVADCYDRGTDTYEALWSPVILSPAAALVRILGLTSRCVVADVGAGTGALLSVIRSAAPDARVVALDASAEMLHQSSFWELATGSGANRSRLSRVKPRPVPPC